MSGGSVVEHIDAVDAYANTLYLRAKQASTSSLAVDTTEAVRKLHVALRHLRIEVSDPDSLINKTRGSVYLQRVRPIVEGSNSTLKQLEGVLDKYGSGGGKSSEDLRERVEAVRSKLVHERAVIDGFLDLVQLDQAPSINSNKALNGNQPSLEIIKDKVDSIARKLFSRRDAFNEVDEDALWREFKAELEKDGFSAKVLREHKDVLRAYIRELESMATSNGGACPSVRGLLESRSRSSKYMNGDSSLHKVDRRTTFPGMPNQLSFDRHSSSSDEDSIGSSAMISTRDLMAMDSLNTSMAGLHIQQPVPGQTRAIPIPKSGQEAPSIGLIDGLYPPEPEISRSFNSQLQASQGFGQLAPPHPAGPALYGSSAPSAYNNGPPMPRLAPDSYGREIPIEAQWTKIKRTLVSPEVLEQAGVRYEARPDYVAILGILSKDQISHYARLSAECRAARNGHHLRRHDTHDKRAADSGHRNERRRSNSFSEDDSSDLADSDDDEEPVKNGTKTVPIIVNPPEKSKSSKAPTSPSTTTKPKPILKNKNTNTVHFGPDPYEVSPHSEKEDRERRDKHSRRHGDERDRRDRDDRDKRRDDDRRRRDSDRHDDDRYRKDDDGYYRPQRSDRDRRDRKGRRRAWGETLGVVGIGGAAATLLGVLAEAAAGM